ncbi:MAG: hypothetical protein D6788_10540, partial [Planctomycetota bacterium]
MASCAPDRSSTGENSVVLPPSTSLAPRLAPALPSVTQQMVPVGVWSSSGWATWPEPFCVCCGSMRFQMPVVAVSFGSPTVQPVSVSMSSASTTVTVPGLETNR